MIHNRVTVRVKLSVSCGVMLLAACLGPVLADGQLPIGNPADHELPDAAVIYERALEQHVTPRVLGGSAASQDSWPSTAALVRAGTFPLVSRFFCGATVVADRYVMTAAHCLFNSFGARIRAENVRAVVGVNDLHSDNLDELIVTNILIHPDYDNSLEIPPNDIALLELAQNVEAPAVDLFAEESQDRVGDSVVVVGWGATRYENDVALDYPSVLQQASLPIVDRSICNAPASYAGRIAANQLCAGFPEGGADACAGDSGGPLYLLRDDVPVQIGIVGFGYGCGQSLFYGIYTDVSHFIPWLGDYIEVPEQSAELIAGRQGQLSLAAANAQLPVFTLGSGQVAWSLLLLLSFKLVVMITLRPDSRR